MREGSGGEVALNHGWDMPESVREGLEEVLKGEADGEEKEGRTMGVEAMGPFTSKSLGVKNCKFPTRAQRLLNVRVRRH